MYELSGVIYRKLYYCVVVKVAVELTEYREQFFCSEFYMNIPL